ncbi:MAG TPA: OmpA family protein [Chitinophagales bacterium]|nr:OmpA family protein [Chitinophagales bacterium]
MKYIPNSYLSMKSNWRLCMVIFVLLFSFSLNVHAQTDMEIANAAFENKEYATALNLYQKLYEKTRSAKAKVDLNFKMAECYRYTGHGLEAMKWYDKAKAGGYENPNYLYHQANIYLQLGDYENAKSKITAFLAAVPDDKDGTLILNNCNYALSLPKDSTLYTFKNESSLNSKYNDYAPIQIKDKLYFTSSKIVDEKLDKTYSYDGEGFSDIYVTSYSNEDKSYNKPKKVEVLNTPFNEGVMTYCEKTKTAYFTKCNDNKSKSESCIIVETTLGSDGNWSAPTPIKLSFKPTNDIEHPAISADGNKLYFASKMEGGNGGSDIWVMKKNGEEWGEPVNLGSTVNTERNEMFPVATETALYFSTDGLAGLGGLDLYVSNFNGDGTLSKPVNLKPPFNSAGDDFFITYNDSEKSKGFLSSNRQGGVGGDDIYSFYLTPVLLTVKGRIFDVESNRAIANAQVVLTASDGTTDTAYTNANGEYSFNLDKNKDYKINAIAPGYFGDSRKLSTQGEKFSKEFSKATGHNYDFGIKRIPKEEIKIEDIYYDYDSYTLREESKPSLDKLVKLLEDTPEANVQINSHTDERGKFDYNMKLSENRAKSVVDYLIEKGINPTRLSSKGFASSQPVVKNAKTEEDHQKNRRTTFQVLKND